MRQNNQSERDLFTPFQPKNKFVNLIFQNNQVSSVTYGNSIICFIITAIIFIGLSCFFFVVVGGVTEYQYTYYKASNVSLCGTGATCNITLSIDKYMKQPVYVLYKLGNFYQNNRRYIQSKSNYQLAGNDIGTQQAGMCHPFITNKDMKMTTSWGGVALDPNAIASPCGSIAYTFFNDTFALSNDTGSIPINQTGISWTGDVGGKFKQTTNSSSTQWINPENQHFIVWMRTSGLPNFKKVWGKVQTDLSPGNYYIVITNNYNSIDWNGDRSVILSTQSLVGGKNFLLPVAFLVVGLISLVAAIVFWRRFKSFAKYSQE